MASSDIFTADKSLNTLSSPLEVTESITLAKTLPFEDVTLTVSLNRDVWVSGMSLFADLDIWNRSKKTIKKVTMALERTITFYDHAAAEAVGSQRYSRIPDRILRKTMATKVVKRSAYGWRGIPSQSKDRRTWMLDVPTGLATIITGKFCMCSVNCFRATYLFASRRARISGSKNLPVILSKHTVYSSNDL